MAKRSVVLGLACLLAAAAGARATIADVASAAAADAGAGGSTTRRLRAALDHSADDAVIQQVHRNGSADSTDLQYTCHLPTSW